MRWIIICVLLGACATNTDAGCISYGIARSAMPADEVLPDGAWGNWVADTDDRMTGTCR